MAAREDSDMFWTSTSCGALVALLAIFISVATAHGQALTTADELGIEAVALQKKAHAKLVRQVLRGKVLWGSLESSIESEDGTMYPFATKSAVARRIFAVCEVEAMLDGESIEAVRKVRRVSRPAMPM